MLSAVLYSTADNQIYMLNAEADKIINGFAMMRESKMA